ncbi:MAG: hypothetical protein C5B43_01625 [Verrucomicrobia bacterium]|nr:MAG: hypothetical protein C5B43_01625 [Verrucomicrobiota bacterium]
MNNNINNNKKIILKVTEEAKSVFNISSNSTGGMKRRLEEGKSSGKIIKLFIPNKTFNYAFDSDIGGCIFTCLFGRQVGTTYTNLKNLLSFALSNKYNYGIVFKYFRELSLAFKNDYSFYIQECFNVENAQDGIKSLMLKGLKGLEDQEFYIAELSDWYHGQFYDYLNNKDFYFNSSEGRINSVMESLSIMLKTKEAQEILEDLLEILYNNLSDKDWRKRARSIMMVSKLARTDCLLNIDVKNKIFNQILNTLDKLLNDNQLFVVNVALIAISDLAEAGIFQGIMPEIIERIVFRLEVLCKDEEKEMINEVLITLDYLAKEGVLKQVSLEVLGRIIL